MASIDLDIITPLTYFARFLKAFAFLSCSTSRLNKEHHMKSTSLSWLLFPWCLSAFSIIIHARQTNRLNEFLKSRHSYTTPDNELVIESEYTPVYISPQDGLMEYDKITALPGQPAGVDFDQYSGYITVDPKAGRALFYYFVESPENSTTNPLVLWLNGGPGCSSLIGAMQEQGPFRVNPDGKTLYTNPYAWNKVANVIFLESPAGVGFSYSNKSSDYDSCGDKNTARDSYTFLVNWLERFPQYKTRDFYLTGESYAGHYIPQLAYTILLSNNNTNQTVINLKGVAIGNAWINEYTDTLGIYDHLWTHGYNSDAMNKEIHACCDVNVTNDACKSAQKKGDSEHGDINIDNIYDPWCDDSKRKNGSTGLVENFDPCTDNYSYDYLNLPIVQQTLHAKPTSWFDCSPIIIWNDAPATTLPLITKIMASGIRFWLYSGDMDGNVPLTSSRYSINTLKLTTRTRWYPWYLNKEVGGYLVEYDGLVFTTVRGAGHEVPSYQPERSLTMINSFLQGKLLPARAGQYS